MFCVFLENNNNNKVIEACVLKRSEVPRQTRLQCGGQGAMASAGDWQVTGRFGSESWSTDPGVDEERGRGLERDPRDAGGKQHVVTLTCEGMWRGTY